MATPRQIAANRANARRSTGPRTAAGRAKSGTNARWHGISSNFAPTAPEVMAAARALFPELCFDFDSTGPDDRQIAALRVAAAELRVRAIRAHQANLDAEINRFVEAGEFVGPPEIGRILLIARSCGLGRLPKYMINAIIDSVIKGPGLPTLGLLDPLTVIQRGQTLLERYRGDAEAERRGALDALPDDLITLMKPVSAHKEGPKTGLTREDDAGAKSA